MHHARYYVGFCSDHAEFSRRLREHRAGHGAKILRAANEKGITYRPIAFLEGDRHRERWIKKLKSTPRFVQQIARGKVKGVIAYVSE